MSAFLDRLNANEALGNLRTGRESLATLHRQMAADFQEARAFTHPDYNPEGIQRQREQRVERVRARYGPQLDALEAQVRRDAGVVSRYAEAHRPRLADDAVALQRAQIKWDQVRMQLEAGRSLPQVLADADEATCLAIGEWGPVWMRAEHARTRRGVSELGDEGPDTTGLANTIDARLAEVATGDAQFAVSAGRETAQALAGFDLAMQHSQAYAQDDRSGQANALHAAIASHYAGAEAVAGLGDAQAGEAAEVSTG